VLSRALAFRPATVVARLPPRSAACPLSARDLVAAAAEAGVIVPVVQAPIAAVARAALVAAKELRAVLGLSLPSGVPSRPWFDAVAGAADELAAGMPLLLSADLIVEGEGGTQIERAVRQAWRLVDDGLTHLAVDVAAVVVPERGRVAGEVAQAGFDRGLSVEIVVPSEGPRTGPRAAALLEELSRRGPTPELVGVRCPAPHDVDEARVQAAALARISQALAGIPVVRRGPVTPRLLELLRASPLKVCEDGGVAAAQALRLVPAERVADAEVDTLRESPLERAAAQLSGEAADRIEAVAYVEVADVLERLGARGGAPGVVRALERRLVDR
jgi:hypothetical protein